MKTSSHFHSSLFPFDPAWTIATRLVFPKATRRTLFICLGFLMLSGTAAVHAAGTIKDISMVPRLLIQGELGETNTIEYADAAQANAWKVLTNVVVTSNPYLFVDLSAAGVGKRFFRLAVPESPPASQTGNPPTNPDPALLVWIPPGTFTMGSPATELDRRSDEGPQTVVTLTKGFYMGIFEVTQGEYEDVMGNNPAYFTGDRNRPVETVSWYDATNYCGKLTQQERAAGRLPAGWEYRLPTEAQREYACCAGTTTRFYYGDDPSSLQLGNYAWYLDNTSWPTHPVGEKLPNRWSLYDMAGNVTEWCSDWYRNSYPGGSVTDPTGPASGSNRVLRGGNWGSFGQFCRSASRGSRFPSSSSSAVGFRVALVAVP